jgi:hypothetical protein
VASFDFVRDGRPACVLAVGPDATAAERAEAERIGAFFRFWYAHTPPADARRVDVEEVRRPGNPYRAWQFAYDGRRAPFRDVRIAVTASPADSPPGLARVVVGCRGRHPDLDRAGAFGAPPEQAGTIWREGNTLFVAGSDLAALRATVDLLLTVLEERYPYDGVFTDSPTPFGRMALPPNPLAVRAGLAGRTLE